MSAAAVHARLLLAACLLFAALLPLRAGDPAGTVDDPIVDSAMSEAEAFAGLDDRCPAELRAQQRLITVLYYGGDHRVHRGQLVLAADLVADIQEIFAVALKEHFPIASVIPVAAPQFRQDGRWSDDLSMAANNSSAFNFRLKTGGTTLSNHALGRALDLNPAQNPYVKGTVVEPPGAHYDPAVPGALTADHPVTQAFLRRGWTWGGTWTSLKDYQHFEKPAAPAPAVAPTTAVPPTH